ncbi:MAG: hypothetical protein EOO06_21300 [Chitinophagaceae bacterium]|nr:MAG: hypothetical protein EOO06_21300 [Chitinophagaceae bacterium]
MKRKIILGVLLVIVVAGSIAAWKYFEKSTNYASKDPDIMVTAKELIAAFDKDTVTASKQFMDKIIRVTGTVKSIDSSAVVLEEEGSASSVVVGLDERNKKSISELKVAEKATLQGKFSGYTKASADPDDLLSSLGTTINIDYAGVINKK